MLSCVLVFALTLTTAGQPQSSWQPTDSQHFEIHYLPPLAPDLDRVRRRAERAYDRVSGRLSFACAKKVPLVMWATNGSLTRDQAIAYSVSDEVAPQRPHPSRIVRSG